MSFSFGVQKDPIFGTYGEFSIGSDQNLVRVQFLLTKMKPGLEGSWENALASQMLPWREVFNVEDLTFDELLQRDLDDSRVAHDLIPYLLGESNAVAKFFPPIMAVLVPRKPQQTGIQSYYPYPTNQTDTSLSFGDLFDFEKTVIEGQMSPLGIIKYNRQKAAFIIVDGQHRAMAVLAIHRQLNQSWQGDSYAGFYNHLTITADQVKHIELPICLVFFPDLHEGNENYKSKGITLQTICREIFLVVNKNAKPVSSSREILLDDGDFAAHMMRQTLSKLKSRGEDKGSIARIYSFAFGDAVSDEQHRKTEAVTGQLTYTSAVALYRIHRAAAFGAPDAFNLEDKSDITDGRSIRNTERSTHILIGTPLQRWSSLAYKSAKLHAPDDVKETVRLLGNMVDEIMLNLFDQFRPFAVHNAEMRALRTRLNDPELRSDPIQRKCYSLLFEGSGVRSVFDEHIKRLREREEENISDYVKNQMKDAITTSKAIDKYEKEIKQRRSARLFNIDYDRFFHPETNDSDTQELLERATTIYDTISTQAFQIAYLMAVLSVVELMIELRTPYDRRFKIVEFVSSLYLNALNTYFSSGTDSQHHTLKGLVKEKRAKVFDVNALSLRGLLGQSVKELNERQWIFFRYAILEMVHCKHAYQAILDGLNNCEDKSLATAYRNALPSLIDSVLSLRESYINAAVKTAINSREFQQEIQLEKARSIGAGKSDTEVAELIKRKESDKETEIRDTCKQQINDSLGEFTKADKIVKRLITETIDQSDD